MTGIFFDIRKIFSPIPTAIDPPPMFHLTIFFFLEDNKIRICLFVCMFLFLTTDKQKVSQSANSKNKFSSVIR